MLGMLGLGPLYLYFSRNVPSESSCESWSSACCLYFDSRHSMHIHQLWLWQTKERIPQNKWQVLSLGKSSFKDSGGIHNNYWWDKNQPSPDLRMVGPISTFPLCTRNISSFLVDCASSFQPFSSLLLRDVSYHPSLWPSEKRWWSMSLKVWKILETILREGPLQNCSRNILRDDMWVWAQTSARLCGGWYERPSNLPMLFSLGFPFWLIWTLAVFYVVVLGYHWPLKCCTCWLICFSVCSVIYYLCQIAMVIWLYSGSSWEFLRYPY